MLRQAGTNRATAIFARSPGNSLFRRIILCSGELKFPDTKRTGNLPQALQIFRRFRVRQRQNSSKQTQIRENSLLFSLFSGNSATPWSCPNIATGFTGSQRLFDGMALSAVDLTSGP
jgi:hypothetical protein